MPAIALFSILLLLMDLYAFRSIKTASLLFENPLIQQGIRWGYWVLNAALFAVIAYVLFFVREMRPDTYKYFYFVFGLLVLSFVPKLIVVIFQVLDDLKGAYHWIAQKFQPEVTNSSQGMSRSHFLRLIGISLASIPFFSIIYGMVYGRFNFRVFREDLSFEKFPGALNGLKVVQISDIHIGSFFSNFKEVEKGIQLINSLEPDLIVFTGDLVNNYAEEARNWAPYFKQLKARIGKYSVLGNHDYGDYGQYASAAEKQANFEAVKQSNRDFGFELLLNENRKISIDGASFSLIGVENWGKPPFPQHGDLNKACEGCLNDEFKLLLSHDPSHWDEQVLPGTDIDLTLSGHTHGMQFGVEVGDFKWSPVKFKYPRWAGLYEEGKQRLYVNRGFGYIGFPGRVGISPEITLLTLSQKKA